jgi:phosphatidate cytidylyltransferase
MRVLQPRDQTFWQKWNLRVVMSFAMVIAALSLVYWGRQTGVLLLVVAVQGNVYRELVLINIRRHEEKRLPTFKIFYYYWFFVLAFYIYGRTLMNHFEPIEQWPVVLRYVLVNHVPFSFWLYIAGFVAFVLSLNRQKYMPYQFSQFAYCHVALVVVVVQSTLLAANLFDGLIWFVMPCGMVVCNDCFAYICGVWCGRTPLIRISPKKTVEGFGGAFFFTVLWAFWFCKLLESVSTWRIDQLMICPKHGFGQEIPDCDISTVRGGIHVGHSIESWMMSGGFVGIPPLLPEWLSAHTVSQFQLHCVVMAVFSSTFAPFGGFFASGFKRAIGEKDYGSAIPGHGGWTDRMDCQIIMGTFSYLYLHYVLTPTAGPLSLSHVISHALKLDAADKLALIQAVNASLPLGM